MPPFGAAGTAAGAADGGLIVAGLGCAGAADAGLGEYVSWRQTFLVIDGFVVPIFFVMGYLSFFGAAGGGTAAGAAAGGLIRERSGFAEPEGAGL